MVQHYYKTTRGRLSPLQPGVGVREGCAAMATLAASIAEACVAGGPAYPFVFVSLDLSNAFQAPSRAAMTAAAKHIGLPSGSSTWTIALLWFFEA
ncbi:hypothetical protein PAPYR_6670 [Paratrimastix pyriformis]|uniref:Reverse transcriptase domain-containing protein n=1 Tax=Paratrimastix pyriformis TaxID=342808 RepID=A0ABQ8UHS8_9EUKA|nr:hypothetical protein PAPYR_6670 [Paratrimastix pyriformis]